MVPSVDESGIVFYNEAVYVVGGCGRVRYSGSRWD
jgi:hypothetical protein